MWRVLLILLMFLLMFGLVQVYVLARHAIRTDIQPKWAYTTVKSNILSHVKTTISHQPGNTTHINGYPRILHHVFYGIDKIQPKWVSARRTCVQHSPGFVHMYWNESAVEEFLKGHYAWFLPVYYSYTYPVQKFDAVRYLLLYHYGGVYLDMDVICRVSLSSVIRSFPLDSQVILQEVDPSGYATNSILFSHARHGFFHYLMHHLEESHQQYFFPYMTIMFSTGPGFFSNSYYNYEHMVQTSTSEGTDRNGGSTASPAQSQSGVYFIPRQFNQKLFYEMGLMASVGCSIYSLHLSPFAKLCDK